MIPSEYCLLTLFLEMRFYTPDFLQKSLDHLSINLANGHD